MPEIRNPDLKSSASGSASGRGTRSAVVFIMLAFMFLTGYQYLFRLRLTEPEPAGQSRYSKVSPTALVAPEPETSIETHKRSIIERSSEPAIQFGWLSVLARPLYLVLRFLHEHGIGNWGWAIIVFTVIFNLVMLWPRTMSMRSSLKMMRIQPKVEALKKRYAHLKINDPKRAQMNTEMMTLYKAEGVNLFGGCLPMLLQMPLLFAYNSVLRNAVELHQAHWFWITDLSLPDPMHILPILIIASMTLTQFITPTPSMNPTQRRLLALMMPAIVGLTLWRYASGLALYWATGNIVNLIIQFLINRSAMGKEMHTLASRNIGGSR